MYSINQFHVLTIDGVVQTNNYYDTHEEAVNACLEHQSNNAGVQSMYAIADEDNNFHPQVRSLFLSYNDVAAEFRKLRLDT